jgi:hypothetical protein
VWSLGVLNAEMISAHSIFLIPVKTSNKVYKCCVRPELLHHVIRRPRHCVIAIDVLGTVLLQPHDVIYYERLTD